MSRFFYSLVAVLVAGSANAECVGTGSFQSCYDYNSGNSYTVNRFGSTTQMTGTNSRTGSSWSQQSQDLGSMTYDSGTSSDGGAWNMTRQNLGGGMTAYSGTDSSGNFFSGTCDQFGCR